MSSHSRPAPGAPGEEPSWTRGSKAGIGTALTGASPLWFTLGNGSLEEIYFPRADQPATVCMALAVTDGRRFFSWERDGADSHIEAIEPLIPAFRIENRCRQNRYRIVKEVIATPDWAAVLQRIRFFPAPGEDLQLYAVLIPQLGPDASGWVGQHRGDAFLFAQGTGSAMALASSVSWLNCSVGFNGESDGLRDLRKHCELRWEYDRAEGGYVVLTGRIPYPAEGGDLLLALGFGTSPESAGLHAVAARNDGFDLSYKHYAAGWKKWQESLPKLDPADERTRYVYRSSMNVMRAHEAKVPHGSLVASLSIPFGQIRKGRDTGGYHLVWPRDLAEAAGGFLAGGVTGHIRDTLCFFQATQEPDGHWPQNMLLNGKPHWNGIQMDETALVVLIFDLAVRCRGIEKDDENRFWLMIRRAAAYLVANGPITQEDRWEVEGGYSTYTMGAEVGALLVAADYADKRGENRVAQYLRETADIWNANIEPWTYVTGTELARRVGVEGYYIRLGEPRAKAGAPKQETTVGKVRRENNVSPDSLALVRFGLRSANDPRIVNTVKVVDAVLKVDLGYGPCWRRYLGDKYGEDEEGVPAPHGHGIGRAWPLFIGERGHYELAAGRRDEAERLLRLMEKTASDTGLIPEQLWDAPDLPDKGLYRGRATTSASPLVWAHAEYVKLLRSLRDGAVFDMPPQTVERYGRAHPTPHVRIWRLNRQAMEIPPGIALRIELPGPAVIRWSAGSLKNQETPTTDTGIGIHLADLPTQSLSEGDRVSFTLRAAGPDRYEHRTYTVKVASSAK